MRRTLLWFAYHGPSFDGYARQPAPDLHTVEDALLDGLVARRVAPTRDLLRMRPGSRTDRGVSARRNALVLDSAVPPERVAPLLGNTVPGIWPLASCAVSEDLDPRRAVSRTYRYHVSRFLLPEEVDLAAWQRAGSVFVGRHDMSAFARVESGKDPMREVHDVRVAAHADGLTIDVVGRSFLWNQVRRMVSAMWAVADGRIDLEVVEAALRAPAEAPDLGLVAAGPLVLWDVRYRDLELPSIDAAHGRRLAAAWADAHGAAWASAAFFDDLARHGAGATPPQDGTPLRHGSASSRSR